MAFCTALEQKKSKFFLEIQKTSSSQSNLKKKKAGGLDIPNSKVVFQRTPSIPKNGIKYLQMTYLVTDLYQNKELNNKDK